MGLRRWVKKTLASRAAGLDRHHGLRVLPRYCGHWLCSASHGPRGQAANVWFGAPLRDAKGACPCKAICLKQRPTKKCKAATHRLQGDFSTMRQALERIHRSPAGTGRTGPRGPFWQAPGTRKPRGFHRKTTTPGVWFISPCLSLGVVT